MEEEEKEEILSEELREQLGGDAMVLPSKRVKKEKAEPEESEEVKALAKKLSKRARKKIEALQKKKETAEKAERYMKELSKHTLTPEQAALMASSRDMGKTRTLKEELSRIMKRKQAGLAITIEEERLLFPERPEVDTRSLPGTDSRFSLLPQSTKASEVEAELKTGSSATTRHAPIYSVATISNGNDVVTSSSSGSAGIGLGSLLLQQFDKIAAAKSIRSDDSSSTPPPKKLSLASLVKTSVFQETVDDDDKGRTYIAVPMAEPVTAMGVVKPSGDPAKAGTAKHKTTKYLQVPRKAEVQAARMQLPVCGLEQEIVETIGNNDVVIICGETGSGKSTQVPQFLYEAGYPAHGLIGVTQPRRVAASSTAARVAVEMNAPMLDREGRLVGDQPLPKKGNHLAGTVSYQVRYDTSTVSDKTAIKFMTDGVLLREATEDILLRKYSVLLIDEAHERNVNTDVLLGLLSRTIPLRRKQAIQETELWERLSPEERERYVPPLRPLKLVVMSATLRVEDFKAPHLFTTEPAVIRVDARQFEVTNHFARRTELQDYLKETHKKVCQIHKKLPPGGILVFLTGKSEIVSMCRRLHKSLGKSDKKSIKHLMKHHDSIEDGDMDGIGDLDRLEDVGDAEARGDAWVENVGADSGEDEGDNGSDGEDDDDGIWENDDDATADGAEEDDGREKDTSSSSSRPQGSVALSNTISTSTAATAVTTSSDDTGSGTYFKETTTALRDRMLREALGITAVIESSPTHAPSAAAVETSASKAEAIETGKGLGTDDDVNDSEATGPEHVTILPLFAMLDPKAQARVFKPVPANHRLIVVATNVAETSITIPGIRYVVDCGRCKERIIDRSTGISRFELRWITKAAAEQRRGRAGRTGPGHCYRLYSSALFDQHMKLFAEPEITTIPLENLLLQMRSMGVLEVENFPFPTPPPRASVRRALRSLLHLGAMTGHVADDTRLAVTKATHKVQVTKLGVAMSKFPVNVRLAKMLVKALGYPSLLGHACTVAAALAENSPFIPKSGSVTFDEGSDDEEEEEEEDEGTFRGNKKGRGKGNGKGKADDERFTGDARWAPMDVDPSLHDVLLSKHPSSDALARHRAVGAYGFVAKKKTMAEDMAAAEKAEAECNALCTTHSLHEPTLQRMLRLREQMLRLLKKEQRGSDTENESEDEGGSLAPPTLEDEAVLKQLVLSGHCDCVAKRVPPGTLHQGSRRHRLTAYQSCDPAIKEYLYIHPESSLYRKDPAAALPEYVCYLSLTRNQRGDTTYMSCVTEVNSSQLPDAAQDSSLLHWATPLVSPAPFYDPALDSILCYTIPSYGTHKWGLPAVKRSLKSAITAAAVCMDGAKTAATTGDVTYRWFARLLLEGAVVPELQLVCRADKLRDSPSAFTNNQYSRRCSAVVTRLVHSGVDSRASLMRQLQRSTPAAAFLGAEIEALLHSEARKAFRALWARLSISPASPEAGTKKRKKEEGEYDQERIIGLSDDVDQKNKKNKKKKKNKKE